MSITKRVYLAGAMGGLPGNGFAAFDKAKAELLSKHPNWVVISPADIDRGNGVMDEHFFETLTPSEEKEWLHNTIKLDLDLLQTDRSQFSQHQFRGEF